MKHLFYYNSLGRVELIERRGLISIAVVCLYVTGLACEGFWVMGVWAEMGRQYKSCFYFISFLFRLLRCHRCMALLMICLPTQHTCHPWFRAGCVCVCVKSTDVVHWFRQLSFQRQFHTLLLPARICRIVPELLEWVLSSQQCWFPWSSWTRSREWPGHFTPKSKEINHIYSFFMTIKHICTVKSCII